MIVTFTFAMCAAVGISSDHFDLVTTGRLPNNVVHHSLKLIWVTAEMAKSDLSPWQTGCLDIRLYINTASIKKEKIKILNLVIL